MAYTVLLQPTDFYWNIDQLGTQKSCHCYQMANDCVTETCVNVRGYVCDFRRVWLPELHSIVWFRVAATRNLIAVCGQRHFASLSLHSTRDESNEEISNRKGRGSFAWFFLFATLTLRGFHLTRNTWTGRAICGRQVMWWFFCWKPAKHHRAISRFFQPEPPSASSDGRLMCQADTSCVLNIHSSTFPLWHVLASAFNCLSWQNKFF